jgi:glycosyltransferase involved in cell wall biosynthesis
MKITIVTVAYNSAKTIKDTIESVLSQTYKNYEYIIVDGKSKDNTLDIVKEYEPRFEGRLSWISEPDKGIYDAMNKGISMATGDVVGILNSDDFYHRNDIFEQVVSAFSDKQVDAIYGDVRFVKDSNLDKTVRYYSSKTFSPKKFRFGFMPAHPSFFTYKRFFDNFGCYKIDYKIAADYELLLRFIYIHKLRCKYIPLDFMKMRLGGVSTASWKSNIILNKEIVRACKENNVWTCLPLLFLKYFIKIFEFVNPRKDDIIFKSE